MVPTCSKPHIPRLFLFTDSPVSPILGRCHTNRLRPQVLVVPMTSVEIPSESAAPSQEHPDSWSRNQIFQKIFHRYSSPQSLMSAKTREANVSHPEHVFELQLHRSNKKCKSSGCLSEQQNPKEQTDQRECYFHWCAGVLNVANWAGAVVSESTSVPQEMVAKPADDVLFFTPH